MATQTKCKWCGQGVANVPKNGVPNRSWFAAKADPRGYFCTLRCGFQWAVREMDHREGYK